MPDSVLETHPVVSWLMGPGRSIVDPSAFLEAFAERVRESRVPVTRITTGVPVLHPNLWSFSGLWQLGAGVSERLYRLTAPEEARSFENSPIRIVYSGGGPVRCNPQQPAEDGEFSIIEDLRRAGLTDYIVFGLPFADGSSKALSLATDDPARFREEDIALFEALVPAVAMNLEVQVLRRTARTLLDTYVGRLSGARVLEGEIRRGSGETIRAVIWLCDLRGFTALSESLSGDDLIELLNQYFGAMAGAVEGSGGEILKFIGDAMLAIFPVDTQTGTEDACGRALAASIEAGASIGGHNRIRRESGAPAIDYGIALHVGDVIYGNIGGETRLDFTVIGPAVNLAARIEDVCGRLGRRVLLSEDFVRASGKPARPMGQFDLKGIGATQTVYAPEMSVVEKR